MRRLLTLLARGMAAALGHWSPPPWVRWSGGKGRGAGQWAWAHKVKAAGLILAVAAVGVGGKLGWQWWQSRPKPATVEFSDDDIEGGVLGPEGELLQSINKAEHDSLIEIRQGFEPEIVKMLEDL